MIDFEGKKFAIQKNWGDFCVVAVSNDVSVYSIIIIDKEGYDWPKSRYTLRTNPNYKEGKLDD